MECFAWNYKYFLTFISFYSLNFIRKDRDMHMINNTVGEFRAKLVRI